MKCISWLNGVVLLDRDKPPLRQGYVMGKLVAASVTHIERLISLGVISTEVGRTLGSIGIVKVVEVSAGMEGNFIGKYFILLPRPGLIGGIDLDGVLADYVVLPANTLTPISEYSALRTETLLHMEFSYIYDLIRYVKDKEVLIVGCGPTAYVIVGYLRRLCNLQVACLGRSPLLPKIAELGIPTANVENIHRKDYDVALVLTTSSYGLYVILKHVRDCGLVLIPPTIPKQVISPHPAYYDLLAKKVKIRVLNYRDLSQSESLSRYLGMVRGLIGNVNNFNELLNSMFHFWRVLIEVTSEFSRPAD